MFEKSFLDFVENLTLALVSMEDVKQDVSNLNVKKSSAWVSIPATSKNS